jgi:hypothetical protein
LEIQKILRRKLAGHPLEILAVDLEAALDEQLMVSRKGADHRCPIDREVMSDEKGLLLLIQIGGAPPGMIEKQILNGAPADLLELDEQRRRKVERRMKPGEPVQEKRHVEIRLGGVQAHPRHTRRSRHGIGVVGLMHMPEKADSNSFHGTNERMLRTWKEYVIGIPTLQSTEQNGKNLHASR